MSLTYAGRSTAIVCQVAALQARYHGWMYGAPNWTWYPWISASEIRSSRWMLRQTDAKKWITKEVQQPDKLSSHDRVYWTVHHRVSWIKRDQLDVTFFLFHYIMLNMLRMLLHSSSGACDLFVELFHEFYCSVRIEVFVLAYLFSGECLVVTCVVVLESVFL